MTSRNSVARWALSMRYAKAGMKAPHTVRSLGEGLERVFMARLQTTSRRPFLADCNSSSLSMLLRSEDDAARRFAYLLGSGNCACQRTAAVRSTVRRLQASVLP